MELIKPSKEENIQGNWKKRGYENGTWMVGYAG